ncbi:type II toxin-antitoxin system VapC family toxin [Rhizobium sp.]
MRLLLDTHVAVWLSSQPALIPAGIKRLVRDPKNEIFVSSISIFEIAVKRKTGRSDAPPMSASEASRMFEASGYRSLHVTPDHAAVVENLRIHHKDPFDHLLIAQAIAEPMYLVSDDAKIALYDCPRIPWE